MKRRAFLRASAGAAGFLLPFVGRTDARPCPPGELGAKGGTSAQALCASPELAEADWLARSSGPGVVWAHDFRFEEEFTHFRGTEDGVALPDGTPARSGGRPDYTGELGYSTSRWVPTGFGSGGYAEFVVPNGFHGMPSDTWWRSINSAAGQFVFPAGTKFTPYDTAQPLDGRGTWTFPDGRTYTILTDFTGYSNFKPPTDTTAYARGSLLAAERRKASGNWDRPFAPFAAGDNGLPQADRAAGGSIPLRRWDFQHRASWRKWQGALYGHRDYWSQRYPDSSLSEAQTWNGDEFYLQFRVRLSASRYESRAPLPGIDARKLSRNDGREYPPGGKLMFIYTPWNAREQIVLVSGQDDAGVYGGTQPFQWYHSHDGGKVGYPLSGTPDVSDYARSAEPGSQWAATCTMRQRDDRYEPSDCWFWPVETWVTLLCRFKMGRNNGNKDDHDAPFKDSMINFWVWQEGWPDYRPLFVPDNESGWFPFQFSDGNLFGLNTLSLTAYMNNQPSFVEFSHSYTQLIFSKQWIPCPRA